tara:strand:- start:634 stop:924 length:291 start_codon:yes stop_codon:yes gene_type:complete
MALQTKTDLQTLDIVGPLGIFCNVAAKGTETEAIGPLGIVFVLPATASSSDPVNVVYIKTGANTWSTVSNVYIKTGASTWSEVSSLNIKTSDGWNT